MKKDKIQLVPIIKAVEEFGVNRQTISNWHDAGLLQVLLSRATLNILKMHGFKNLRQIIKLSRKELLKLRHFGMKCLVGIEYILEPYGLEVGMDISSISLQDKD